MQSFNVYQIGDTQNINTLDDDEMLYGTYDANRSNWGSIQSFGNNPDLFLAKALSGIQRLFYGKFDPFCDEINEFTQCQRSINSKFKKAKIGYLTTLLLAFNSCKSLFLEVIIKDSILFQSKTFVFLLRNFFIEFRRLDSSLFEITDLYKFLLKNQPLIHQGNVMLGDSTEAMFGIF